MTGELVHVTHQQAVRTLTLDSPRNRNALSSRLLDQLADELSAASTDPDVRVIVLTATGSVFCSGADLSERTAAVTSRLPEILTTMTRCAAPVICRVNGHARAGGLGLITASDFAVAPAASTFGFSEVRVGVAPAIILVPALRVGGRRFLARMALTGDPFSAAEAAEAGLLSDVVDDASELDGWVERVTSSVLKSAPRAVAATKVLLGELSDVNWSDGLAAAQERSAELFAGDEAGEGMDAFLNKRLPSWDTTAP